MCWYTYILYSMYLLCSHSCNNIEQLQSARKYSRHGRHNMKSFPEFTFITVFTSFCSIYFCLQKWDSITYWAGSAECFLNNTSHVESWLQITWFYLIGKFTNTTYFMLVTKVSNMLLCCPLYMWINLSFHYISCWNTF